MEISGQQLSQNLVFKISRSYPPLQIKLHDKLNMTIKTNLKVTD